MKVVLSFYRIVVNGRPAPVSSALLFHLFLTFLLAPHIHLSSQYFQRENALSKSILEQNLVLYEDLLLLLQKAAKKILINIKISLF